MENIAASSASIPRIWVVDDSPLQGELSRRALSSRYAVELFERGETLLEALASNSHPDLLVVDWHMPDLSGADVCTFVRQSRDSGQLPILVLTATGEEETLVEALRAGANDFVRKPFAAAELHARVAALLRNRHLHAALEEAESRLHVEAKFRERFMGMLAHDLRQPLSTFVLANATLAKKVGDEHTRLLSMQRRAAGRMERMIAELLDFTRSRPETGMPIERAPMNFAEIAHAAVEEIRVAQPEHAIELRAEGISDGAWDRDRVAQICSNLIGNAITHGAQRTPIEVAVVREGEFVTLSVSNQGKRIPDDLMPYLFDPFRRGRAAGANAGSVGLGLYIVAEIARAHGGEVSVRSDDAQTVFAVKLPIDLVKKRIPEQV